MALIGWAERAYLPDSLMHLGIRQILEQRLKQEGANDEPPGLTRRDMALQRLRQAEVTQSSDIAQHYELPTRFSQTPLGPYLKHSCAYWQSATTDLAQAEETMLLMQSARLRDGQSVFGIGLWLEFT